MLWRILRQYTIPPHSLGCANPPAPLGERSQMPVWTFEVDKTELESHPQLKGRLTRR